MAMLLRLAYDGTAFHGYDRPSASGLRTVQGELEAALSSLYKVEIETRSASRTDAGVHARGQIVAFDPPFAIPARGVVLGLAARLPRDVVALAAWEVDAAPPGPYGPEPLNPRFHNLGKRYRYRIRTAQLRDPFSDRYEWHLPRPIEFEAMKAAAPRLVGEHDFAGFRAGDCQSRTTRRRIRAVEVQAQTLAQVDPLTSCVGRVDNPESVAVIEIDVVGDAFLKNMVRVLAGTLAAIGRGQFGPERIDEVLASGDRSRAGSTAPARGLTLIEVLWPASLGGRHDASRDKR